MKFKQQQATSQESSESGFTIIESLMAIIVVSILLAAIAPVLVLSTATRVQARRVELATQAAKAFIDAIQSKTIADPDRTRTLSAATSALPRTLSNNTSDYLLNIDTPNNTTGLYCFSRNGSITEPGSCPSQQNVRFYIQAIRFAVNSSEPDKGQGYRLGIRVYRNDTDFPAATASKDGEQGKNQSTFTGGLGSRKKPLVEMTTEIVRGQPSYGALCSRLGGCQ
ncbi:unknown protein [Rivularia sp. IAM M-261]|nr:unknown protein [Rivularia sp. IAM M-261]